MWTYNKVLEYPIKIKCKNPQLAKFIISQYGGPDFICYYKRPKINMTYLRSFNSKIEFLLIIVNFF